MPIRRISEIEPASTVREVIKLVADVCTAQGVEYETLDAQTKRLLFYVFIEAAALAIRGTDPEDY